jgi:hypothetical protein
MVHFSIADQICIGLSDVDIQQALITDPKRRSSIKSSSLSRFEKKHVNVLLS